MAYSIAYRLPRYSADGNFEILEDGQVICIVDPDGLFDPVDQRKLAGKILIALEHWASKP